MMKTEPRALAYALTILGALNLACSNTPLEGTGGASDGSTGDTDGSASAASNTAPTTTTQGSVSNSATESSISGNSASMTDAITEGLTTEGLTGTSDDTQTTSPVDPSDTGTTTSTSTTDPGTSTSTDTTGGTSTTTDGDTTTTTDGDTTTTGDSSTGDPIECGLQLKATIRDFKNGHPDFESYCCGVVPGLVKPDLGVDKKPVFNQVGNPKMLTDAPTFNQWYNNTNGVNMSTQILLDLQEIQPGVYSYQNNSFFPIDNQLFGNEGNGHNFHFTTEIHSSFTYSGGEKFTFTGDDDVWVFINKKLVIDIGGVHGNSPGTIDLDTLGLSMGANYPLDVFHAERHTTQSNFRIDTTICSQPQ